MLKINILKIILPPNNNAVLNKTNCISLVPTCKTPLYFKIIIELIFEKKKQKIEIVKKKKKKNY